MYNILPLSVVDKELEGAKKATVPEKIRCLEEQSINILEYSVHNYLHIINYIAQLDKSYQALHERIKYFNNLSYYN